MSFVQIHVQSSNKASLERSPQTKSTGVYVTSLMKNILSNDVFFSLKNRRNPTVQHGSFPYSRSSSYVEDAIQAGDPSPEEKPDVIDEIGSRVVTNGSIIPWACIVLFIFHMNLPILARSYVPHDTFITWSLAAIPVFGFMDASRYVRAR